MRDFLAGLALGGIFGLAAIIRCGFWRRRADHWFAYAMKLEGEKRPSPQLISEE